MSDEQVNFKVTDRRLFNADGTPREVPPEEKPEPASSQVALDAESQGASTATDEVGTPEHEEEFDLPGVDDPASFVNFLMSLAQSAAVALGLVEHPVTRQRVVDLQAGKHWIDTLGMLEKKTSGNLTSEEAKFLAGLLADLRMQYVSSAEAGSQKASRTYSGSDITGGR